MNSPVRSSLSKLALCAQVLAAAAGLARGAQDAPDPGDEVTPRGFAIPDTRQARALADRAAAHVDAQRYSEALADLQELLVSHRGEVLRITPKNEREQPVYRGASDWACEQLLGLPERARTLYRDRYGADAAKALELARVGAERRELVEVARRYPLCDAARDAWWTLGDVELELGNREAARDAWQRASELTIALGGKLGDAAQRRVAFLGELARAPEALAETLPGENSPSWRRRFDDSAHRTPFNIEPHQDPYSIIPCLSGDTVLVCDTMRLFAFDAWSGNPRWASDEAPGWDAVDAGKVLPNGALRPLTRKDFFAGFDERSVLAQPAASAGVAVAALQIPVTQDSNKDFQNYKITTVIPDRRLFAFDLATGRELWNHMPPPAWDGESGSFSERMRVAGPPAIAGARILVPAYRMQGRVDMQVACYDLFSGRLQWSTGLISGQLELNMFGRQQREFSAAPIVVVGERAIVLTQLGAIACLDVATGEIRWQTLYEQNDLPYNGRGADNARAQYWNNAAPRIAPCDDGDVVVATPLDSDEMLGLDLEHGTLLWHTNVNRFQRQIRSDNRLTLLDADADSVLLCSTKIVSGRAPRGLRDGSGPVEISESLDMSDGSGVLPRAAASAHHVVVAGPHRRVALQRHSLRLEDRLATADWKSDETPGNAVCTDGAVFFANSRFLTACVDFPAVEKRYRERTLDDPRDVRAALDYAQLLERRAASLLANDARVRESIDLLAKARAALEPHASSGERVAAELFSILYLEAQASRAAADPVTALARLERARTIAPDDGSRARALVATYELCDSDNQAVARERALAELEHCCASLPMPEDWWETKGRETFAPEPGDGETDTPVAIGLWAVVERVHEAQRQRNVAAELVALHEILARYDDARVPPLDGSRDVPSRASAMIQVLLDGGAREAYAPFEHAAREMLDRARATNDPKLLDRLTRLYPHSEASREALDARLQAALEGGDAPSVVQIALRRIPDDWFPPRARPEQVEGLLALGAALDARGNHELQRALLASLARHHADLVSPLPRDKGATIGALAKLGESPAAPVEPISPTFGPNPTHAKSVPGRCASLGVHSFSAGGASETLLVVARRLANSCSVVAYDAATPEEPRWECALPPNALDDGCDYECTTDAVLLAQRSGLTAVDAARGQVRWTWEARPERIEALVHSSGVALLVLRASDGRTRTLALDATSGLQLWTRPTPRELWSLPVVGADSVVLLPADYAATPARVLDLFTGSRVLDFALPEHVGESDLGGAWIDERTLVLPSFPKTSGGEAHDCVSGWDLDTGKRTWRVPGDEKRDFDSIVRRDDKSYLIFQGGTDVARTGFVLELDTRLGATRPLQNVAISSSDVLVGVARHHVATLRGPYLLVRSAAPGETETLLRGIHLPYGERWVHRMQIAPSQFYTQGLMPFPELSETTLALVHTAAARKGTSNGPQTWLEFFDRDNGLLRNARQLPPEIGGVADGIELAGLGSGLWVIGREAVLILY